MTVQEQAFHRYYSSLTDAELMKIATNKQSYLPIAQETLEHEIRERHLPEVPRAAGGQTARSRAGLFARMRKLLTMVAVVIVATSCSSGPTAPQAGTPAFYWAAAKETYRAGDFLKTDENLQRILATENEFTARARAWDTVLSAGITEAYIELADAYEAGARMNRANPTPFRKQVSTLRSLASASAIQFTENLHKLMDGAKEPAVLLAFTYPAGAVAPPAGLKRITGGILVQDSERDLLQAAMLQRGVLLAACRAVGNPDDAAAAQEKLKSGEYQAPRDVFLVGAAKSLQEQSDLFTSTKLDQPNRLKLMSQEALEALRAVPQTKETKVLTEKIQTRLKKAKLTT